MTKLLHLLHLLLLTSIPLTISGFSTIDRPMSQRRAPKSTTTQLQASVDLPVESETEKAVTAVQRCAKVTALSAIVDTTIYGARMFHWQEAALLICLQTIWKASFAVNLWEVSKRYAANMRVSDPEKRERGLLRNIKNMTRIWRITAFMVFLTAATDLVVAWKDYVSVSYLHDGVIWIAVAAATACIYTSHRDTEGIVKMAKEDPDSIATICQHGVVMTRAMLLSSAALLLQATFVSAVAVSSVATNGQATILGLLNVPAPLAMSKFLYNLRSRNVGALSELGNKNKHKKDDSDDEFLAPSTHIELSKAQQQFYGEVESTFKCDMICKVLFLLCSGRGVLEILATIYANIVS